MWWPSRPPTRGDISARGVHLTRKWRGLMRHAIRTLPLPNLSWTCFFHWQARSANHRAPGCGFVTPTLRLASLGVRPCPLGIPRHRFLPQQNEPVSSPASLAGKERGQCRGAGAGADKFAGGIASVVSEALRGSTQAMAEWRWRAALRQQLPVLYDLNSSVETNLGGQVAGVVPHPLQGACNARLGPGAC
jgi:hypothetical protein